MYIFCHKFGTRLFLALKFFRETIRKTKYIGSPENINLTSLKQIDPDVKAIIDKVFFAGCINSLRTFLNLLTVFNHIRNSLKRKYGTKFRNAIPYYYLNPFNFLDYYFLGKDDYGL